MDGVQAARDGWQTVMHNNSRHRQAEAVRVRPVDAVVISENKERTVCVSSNLPPNLVRQGAW